MHRITVNVESGTCALELSGMIRVACWKSHGDRFSHCSETCTEQSESADILPSSWPVAKWRAPLLAMQSWKIYERNRPHVDIYDIEFIVSDHPMCTLNVERSLWCSDTVIEVLVRTWICPTLPRSHWAFPFVLCGSFPYVTICIYAPLACFCVSLIVLSLSCLSLWVISDSVFSRVHEKPDIYESPFLWLILKTWQSLSFSTSNTLICQESWRRLCSDERILARDMEEDEFVVEDQIDG